MASGCLTLVALLLAAPIVLGDTVMSVAVASAGQQVTVVNGKPKAGPASANPSPAAAPATVAGSNSWDATPTCGAYTNEAKDTQGHLWAWDAAKNASCAVRKGSHPALSGFQQAPRCLFPPTTSNSHPDASGNLWGWDGHASCAFKDAAGKPLTIVISISSPAPHPSSPSPSPPSKGSWEATPTCGTYSNEVKDAQGHLWAWDTAKNASCAVRDGSQAAESGFAKAPRCLFLPTAKNSLADSYGNLWGWSGNSSCAFKDNSGLPLSLTGSPSPASSPSHGPAPSTPSPTPKPPLVFARFDEAPACPVAPTSLNSYQDENGRLWGASEDGTACAYKSPVYGTAIFYSGYVRHGSRRMTRRALRDA